MNSRERVLTACRHQEPDKVPLDFGGTVISSITSGAYHSLLKYIDREPKELEWLDIISQVPKVNSGLQQKLGADIRGVVPDSWSGWNLEIEEDDNYRYITDVFNIKWRKPKDGGLYYDLFDCPLEGAKIDDLQDYDWPNPNETERLKSMVSKAKEFHTQKYATINAYSLYSLGYFQTFSYTQGFKDAFIKLVKNRRFTNSFLTELHELEMQFWEWFLPWGGEALDIVLFTDDFGEQNQLLISPEHFRKYFKPRYTELFSLIKKKAPHIKIMLHCDGAIYDILPDLIEMGVDILNPIQPRAKGMDLKRIKSNFGDQLIFWGGFDTQQTLSKGTPQEVKDEVKRVLDILAPGGGYIFNTSHNIQNDTPPENIMAMYETFNEYRAY